jgi:hypothetical protein
MVDCIQDDGSWGRTIYSKRSHRKGGTAFPQHPSHVAPASATLIPAARFVKTLPYKGGRKSKSQPRAASACRMLAALCTLKLSSTTTCPDRSVGPSCSLMYQAKVGVFIAPSISHGSRSPSGVRAATNVVFLP